MIQVAFVGVAHIHTPGFISAVLAGKGMTTRWVWDWNRARGEARAAELGATYADDIRRICDDLNVAAAIICSETVRHEELAIPLATARKHLFIEKPIGMGARDAYAIADAVEKAQIIFQTGYRSRGEPILQFLTEHLSDFGTVTRMRASMCHSGALGRWFDTDWRWMADPEQAGCGAFGDLGTHGLDNLLRWAGAPVERVSAVFSTGRRTYGDCDQLGEALIEFRGGRIATLAASWEDSSNPVSYEICGTEGHAVVMNDHLYFQSARVDGADGKAPWIRLPQPVPAGLDAFLDAITGTPAQLVDVREAAYRVSVMEAMYKAARERSWVTPSEA